MEENPYQSPHSLPSGADHAPSRNARNRLVTIVWLIAGIVEVAVGLPMFFMGRWLERMFGAFFPFSIFFTVTGVGFAAAGVVTFIRVAKGP